MDLSITFCGDITIGPHLVASMGPTPLTDWLSAVSDAWRDSDLLIGNLEGPCISTAKPVQGIPPELVLSSPADRVPELAAAGFSALTLANNHILNYGELGLTETISALSKAGIYYAGAGLNLTQALEPAYIPVRGSLVALVAFSYAQPAARARAGVAPCDSTTMRRVLKAARATADFVVAVLHDGLEYSDVPPSLTRQRLHFLADNGADIVVGHHPHVLQGLEWRNNVPIACSLGDFLSDNSLPEVAAANFSRIAMAKYAPEEVRRDPSKFSRGALLTVSVRDGKKTVTWHPFRQDPSLRPQASSGEDKLDDLTRLEELSAALLNADDPRHRLADSVFTTAWCNDRDRLTFSDVISLALRPRWRYVPAGLRWLRRRICSTLPLSSDLA